jgi:hypothetical protein
MDGTTMVSVRIPADWKGQLQARAGEQNKVCSDLLKEQIEKLLSGDDPLQPDALSVIGLLSEGLKLIELHNGFVEALGSAVYIDKPVRVSLSEKHLGLVKVRLQQISDEWERCQLEIDPDSKPVSQSQNNDEPATSKDENGIPTDPEVRKYHIW